MVASIADAPDETLPPIPDRTPIEPPTREADAPRPAEGPSGAKVLRFERQGHVRVHWKRVVAASLVLMVLEGAAFATAYWYVKPKEMGFLWVRSSVPGVAVAVDGQARGRTPVGLELPPGRHTLEMRGFGVAKVLPVEIAANVETSQLVTWPKPRRVGTLRVTSTPTGARVLLDGEPRGVTPLAIEQVAAGTHALVVEGPTGSVEQPVEIEADGTVTVDVPIYSGWHAVFAPIEVRIFLSAGVGLVLLVRSRREDTLARFVYAWTLGWVVLTSLGMFTAVEFRANLSLQPVVTVVAAGRGSCHGLQWAVARLQLSVVRMPHSPQRRIPPVRRRSTATAL